MQPLEGHTLKPRMRAHLLYDSMTLRVTNMSMTCQPWNRTANGPSFWVAALGIFSVLLQT